MWLGAPNPETPTVSARGFAFATDTSSVTERAGIDGFHEHVGHIRGKTNRCEVSQGIVAKLHQRRIDRVARRHDKDRVTVGCGFRRDFRRDRLTRACAVVDDDLLLQPLRKTLAERARKEVGCAARQHAYEKADRARRVVRLRER